MRPLWAAEWDLEEVETGPNESQDLHQLEVSGPVSRGRGNSRANPKSDSDNQTVEIH